LEASDLYRLERRWESVRESLGMTVAASPNEFARGGLAGRCEWLEVRVLVQPIDPFGDHVRIDDELRDWMTEVQAAEHLDQWMRLIPTSHALAGARWVSDDENWEHYLAITRAGAIDSGCRVAFEANGVKHLSLRSVVRIVADAAKLGAAALQRWPIEGPWEVSLALINVDGAQLGGFARGHNDHFSFRSAESKCHESCVLHRWIADELDVTKLCIEAGDRVENSFGSTHRRHLVRGGDLDGQVDLWG
jgi:hypothetical protein